MKFYNPGHDSFETGFRSRDQFFLKHFDSTHMFHCILHGIPILDNCKLQGSAAR